MSIKKYQKKASSIYRLALFQKGLRILLRATWMGGAGYLFGWCLNEFWGWFPNSNSWMLIALVFVLLNVISIFIKPLSRKRFLWRVDRKLKYKEQISTANQVAEFKKGSLSDSLVEDAMRVLPEIKGRIADKGWNLRGEVESAVIVFILLLIVLISSFEFKFPVGSGGFGFFPSLSQDPSAENVFPSGIPGLTPEEASELGIDEGSDSGNGDGQRDPSDVTSNELGEIGDVLRELGEALGENSATSELGQALQQGDFGEAANELGNLAENLENLSDETLQDLSENLQKAADGLTQPGQQDLAEALHNAAEALGNSDYADAGQQLDELAEQMKDLNELIGGEQNNPENSDGESTTIGVGQTESEDTTQSDRIEGGSQIIDLSEFDDPLNFLRPSELDSVDPNQDLPSEYDFIAIIDGSVIEGVYDPYMTPWIWKDVVEKYFTR